MSSRKRTVALSPAVRRDVRSILLSSRQRWGDAQRDAYQAAINRALKQLGTYPEIGRQRDDLSPNLRSYPVHQHILYYRIEADRIRVTRILHRKMDATDLFEEPLMLPSAGGQLGQLPPSTLSVCWVT